jgi:hypothetical protein
VRRSCLSWLAMALCLAIETPAFADPEDKAGWSVLSDPRHRAFLIWVPEQGGPRVLMFGCLRDAGMFTTMSYAVGERDEIDRVTLTLSNGSARFEVDGSITRYPAIGRSSFISDLDVDEEQLRALGRKLLPVLEGSGDIGLTIAPAARSGAASAIQIAIAGLASVLGRFRDVCFR